MTIFWIGFIVLILFFLALDLGVFNKNAHVVSAREALGWTAVWVTVSLLFSGFIYWGYEQHWLTGPNAGNGSKAWVEYISGYLVEQSLSIDNIFVIAIIFTYFKIPAVAQHRVLFWGILGALIFRGIMIGVGAFLVNQFQWVMYVFGAILLYTAYKMLGAGNEDVHPDKNPVIKLVRRFYPVTSDFHGSKFFIVENGIKMATPLFIALMVVESTDVMFAFDSIPAIFGITTDPFLVFTSNIFAILGLRSLYFLLASILDRFELLKYSLVVILAFVGVKLMLHEVWHPQAWVSLLVIVVVLAAGVVGSLWLTRKQEKEQED